MSPANFPPANKTAASVSLAPTAIQFKTKQVKTKISEIIKKRPDGSETVFWEVRVGSAVAKVYFTPSGKRDLFTLSYWTDGKRKREVFSSKEKAVEAAKKAGGGLTSGELLGPDLTAKQRVACARALEVLSPTGVPIEAVASEYAQAFTRLKGVPLLRAVDFYLSRFPVDRPAKMVKDVADEMVRMKRADKLSDRYVNQLEYDLKRFTSRFRGRMEDIRGADVDTWLRDLGVGPRTRNNMRSSVHALIKFAVARKYLPKDHDEMDAVPVAKDNGGEIEIFTPKEMAEILARADAQIVPFLALGAFAGIRHAEIQRLDWKNIQFDAAIIEIRAAKAKTASRRTVPIFENLRAWLIDLRKEDGAVCAYRDMGSEIETLVSDINKARRAAWAKDKAVSAEQLTRVEEKAREAAKAKAAKPKQRGEVPPGAETARIEGWVPFAWKHNALRHSFISYRVAEIQDVAKVSLEAGNSPQMIFKHYRELVRPEAAKAWFSIKPEMLKMES